MTSCWRRWRASIGDRELVLTPSGALAAVPWSCCPQPRSRRHRRAVRDVLAGPVGDPAAGPHGRLRGGTGRGACGVGDVGGLGRLGGAEVLHGPGATAVRRSSAWRAGSTSCTSSAHGRHSSENPLFSGLELADGPWYGYDIDQLEGIPDVVLLSACEVGRSTMRGGEELIGMTAAWLHAGARCVMASRGCGQRHGRAQRPGRRAPRLAEGRHAGGLATRREPRPLTATAMVELRLRRRRSAASAEDGRELRGSASARPRSRRGARRLHPGSRTRPARTGVADHMGEEARGRSSPGRRWHAGRRRSRTRRGCRCSARGRCGR